MRKMKRYNDRDSDVEARCDGDLSESMAVTRTKLRVRVDVVIIMR